jgi:hypothetical protein
VGAVADASFVPGDPVAQFRALGDVVDVEQPHEPHRAAGVTREEVDGVGAVQ